MSYPNSIDSYTTKINKNASGWYVPTDYVVIPAATPYESYLDHVPRDVATTAIADYTYTAGVPTVGQYNLDLVYGKVTFSAGNTPTTKNATYYSLGDDIMAEHMNDAQTAIVAIENTLGTNPEGASATVKARLDALDVTIAASGIDGQRITDDTIRAGALMNDIKGSSWASLGSPTLQDIEVHKATATAAHAATAISVTGLGGTTFVNVSEHVRASGHGTPSDTNPHGTSISDISITDLNLRPGGNVTANIIYGYNASFGNVMASGNLIPEASGFVAGPDYNQHSCVGTAAFPFASGNFDKLQASSYLTGGSTGVDGIFTSADSKTITVKNGLVVSIV